MGFTIPRLDRGNASSKDRLNKYIPSAADRRTVTLLAAAGYPQEQIAEAIGSEGIGVDTLYQHYGRELRTARSSIVALAMNGLVQGLKKAQPWAVCFTLKCRAGWREDSKISIEVSGAQKPVELTDMDRLIADADAVESAERNTITLESSDSD